MIPVEVFIEVRDGKVVDVLSDGRAVKVYVMDWDRDGDKMGALTGLDDDDLGQKVDDIVAERGWSSEYVDNMDFNQLL